MTATNPARETEGEDRGMVKCGNCRFFIRDGKCDFFASPQGRAKDRPFERAPFWVWSDCYSDKEQVRASVETLCPTFAAPVHP